MAQISVQRYVLASLVGMLPSQGLHIYIGSTLRSMEEVVSSSPTSTLAYFVFGGQVRSRGQGLRSGAVVTMAATALARANSDKSPIS